MAEMASAPTKVDWSYFIGKEGRRWRPSPIRALFPLEKKPGVISLLAGKPNPSMFPFEAISFKAKDGTQIDVTGPDLEEALQYGMTPGLPRLISWLQELQHIAHRRDYADGDWDLTTTNGSQDAITKVFAALLDPGDSVLAEAPAYPGALSVLHAHPTANIVEVNVDCYGLHPDEVEDILADWFKDHPNKHFPKVLYTIPTASNPSGCSASIARRKRILELAVKYNFLILEDDAYAFLRFNRSEHVPSYFELDGQLPLEQRGRVIRLDTMSKVISAGMRLGVLTAAKPLIDNVNLQSANQNLHPSSITGIAALSLFEHWGHQGFFEHCDRVADFYKSQCILAEKYARKHLDGLATWVSPEGGMFLYLELNIPDGVDTNDVVGNEAYKEGVLAVPGSGFSATNKPSHFVRISYSFCDEAEFDEAFRRLGNVVRRVNKKHAHTALFPSVPPRSDA